MSREEIEQKLEEARADLQNVHGEKCEVYSRVVGYLRPVQAWNKGKKEEYDLRKTYNVETV
jgi:anaerobic ribonucleoside-triphosphate reductase